MRLLEQKHCFLVSDIFFSDTVIGFTKPSLAGHMPQDLYQALSFLGRQPQLSYMRQLHSALVEVVSKPGVYEADGLFCGQANHVLAVRTADCLPLLLYSPEKDIVGAVHMGWRSAQAGILENISFDLSSFAVIAGIGLRQCCYEVGEEFLEYQRLKPFLERKGNKLFFDPIAFARANLVKKGLPEDNFFDLGLCNFCMERDFFSYRKSHTEERIISFILKM